ncbi:MAG: CapA family protein [Paracoccaceae bacterium]
MRLLSALALVLAAALPEASAWAQDCPAPQPAPVNRCDNPARMRLAIVGDVLVHQALAWRGYQRGFDSLWYDAVPALRDADLTIANLEGPVAPGLTRDGRRVADPGPVFDDRVYTEYPAFNYHPVLIDALRQAGVDVVTTANNHAMDRGRAGAEATLAALDAAGMAHVGSVPGGQDRATPLRLRTPVGPLSLFACTFGTNGLADPRRQVPLCYDDAGLLARRVADEVARGAAVMVLPHWGQEYSLDPDADQRRFARQMAEAGAFAVVGTHPHVPQPWDMLETARGTVPVIYSTGNFIAAQPPLERATAILARLDLCQSGGRVVVGAAGYIPLQMEFDGADPSLTLPRPGMGPRAEAGLQLLERLIPGRSMGASGCAATAPARRVPGETPPQVRTDR